MTIKPGDLVVRDDNAGRHILLTGIYAIGCTSFPIEPVVSGAIFLGVYVDDPGVSLYFFEPFLTGVAIA